MIWFLIGTNKLLHGSPVAKHDRLRIIELFSVNSLKILLDSLSNLLPKTGSKEMG